ncbi:hypothetical protein A2160_05540 [Candidatus Beckwithbacteria bacterium RBG_13_42_9]|uniref:ribose-phosphate diphosphokinase n=1 Tax=Candidatus Beckwithbacteria bacterium RBG_13_42_9 TaxID=1797457 RepID=A0A1F5E5Z9_9BACT|nr:MAG: hypothetical protein A2160_05540 [Candidatus Beckwithbacteria bacterium RBG_13_42_9]
MFVLSGSSNLPLAKKLAKKLACELTPVELSRFPNSEARVWIKSGNINDTAVVLQSFSDPADNHILEFCLLVDAVRRLGAKQIVVVIPWMGYCIQDKIFRRGEPLSARVVADIIQSTKVDSIITVDLHNETTLGFFNTPLIHLSANPLFVEFFKKKGNIDVLVAPDIGAAKESGQMARELGLPLATISKKRDLNTGKVTILGIEGEVKGKRVLITDDFISTGSTLIQTAEYLKKRGATKVTVAVTHHLFVPGVQEKLEKSQIDELYISDTIKNQYPQSKLLQVLSLAGIIAEAIKSRI